MKPVTRLDPRPGDVLICIDPHVTALGGGTKRKFKLPEWTVDGIDIYKNEIAIVLAVCPSGREMVTFMIVNFELIIDYFCAFNNTRIERYWKKANQ